MSKRIVTLVAIFSLTACQAPAELAILDNTQDAPTVIAGVAPSEPSPDPETSPSPAPVAAKPLLSQWTRVTGREGRLYGLDLRALPAGTGSVYAQGRAVFSFSQFNSCNAMLVFDGSTSSGTLTVTNSRSVQGSPTGQSVYCDPLEGVYDYALVSDGLRLTRAGGEDLLQ